MILLQVQGSAAAAMLKSGLLGSLALIGKHNDTAASARVCCGCHAEIRVARFLGIDRYT